MNGLLRMRRGPWEMVETILIALGVFMLMQPFALVLYSYSFLVTLIGTVRAVEYLGTTQIVTLETANGMVKARVDADVAVAVGETGLAFDERTITLFDEKSGTALLSAGNEGV